MRICPQCGQEEITTARATLGPNCIKLNRSEGAKRGVEVKKERMRKETEEGVRRKREEWRQGPVKPRYGYFGLYGFMKLDANGAATV